MAFLPEMKKALSPPQRSDSQECSLWATRSPRNGSSLQNHLERLHFGRNVRGFTPANSYRPLPVLVAVRENPTL